MSPKYLTNIVIVGMILTLTLSVQAQKPPTDLTELNIEEILALHIKKTSQDRWRVGYSYLRATFDGYRDGTNNLSNEEVLFEPAKGDVRTEENFPVLPTEIVQQAHIIEVSYSFSEKVGFNLLLPYIHQSTDHISIVIAPIIDDVGDTVGVHDFSNFVISSSGIGDISLSASYTA